MQGLMSYFDTTSAEDNFQFSSYVLHESRKMCRDVASVEQKDESTQTSQFQDGTHEESDDALECAPDSCMQGTAASRKHIFQRMRASASCSRQLRQVYSIQKDPA